MTINYSDKSLSIRYVLTLAGLITLSACNDNTELVDIVEDGEAGVISLKANAEDVQLAVGQTFTLSATAAYDSGAQSTFSDEIKWVSSDDTIATVDGKGTVTAIAPGQVNVSHHWRRISGTTVVAVTDAELASIDFSSSQLEANECSEASVTAVGTYSDGTTQALSSISQWSSDDDTVVQVKSQEANSAELLLLNSGVAAVTLTSGSIATSMPVTVTDTLTEIRIESDVQTFELETEHALRITGLFADGTENPIDTIASYSLTGAPGDSITNAPDSILLDTHPDPTPTETDATTDTSTNTGSSTNPDTDTNTGSGTNSGSGANPTEPESSGAIPEDNELVIATTSTLDLVQLQDNSLLIKAKQAGSVTLNVACAGLTTSLPLTVVDPPTVESVSFASVDAEIEPAGSITLELTAQYSDGSSEDVSDNVQWSLLSGDLDSFQLNSTSGTVTANPDLGIEQSVIVQASFESLTAQTEVFANRGVSEDLVSTQLYYVDATGESVPLTANNNTLSVGDTLQLTVKAVYNSGREEFSVTDLFWSNLNPAIASIDGAGLLTAHAAGISSISAIKDSLVTTFQFSVVEAVVEAAGSSPVE